MKKLNLLSMIAAMALTAGTLSAQTHYGPDAFDTYTEDFEDDVADGFVAVSSDAADWVIEANENLIDPEVSYSDGLKTYHQTNGDDMVWSILDDKTFENYTVEVDLYPVWGNKTGLFFNYQDENNFYVLEYWSSPNSQRMYLRHKVDGTWENGEGGDSDGGYLWDADSLYEADYPERFDNTTGDAVSEWFETGEFDLHLKIVNADGKTSVYLNETATTIMDVTTDQFTSGKVGFFTHWSPAYFDNLVVSSNAAATSVENLEFTDVSVYPNPVKGGALNVDASEFGNNTTLNVYDISGKLVYSDFQAVGALFSVDTEANFSNGLYMIEVQSDSKVYSGKVIIN